MDDLVWYRLFFTACGGASHYCYSGLVAQRKAEKESMATN